jgi:phytoene dehydrogenase-like protein
VANLDAVVVGAGPNGLTAASVLARAGLSVLVVEGSEHVGGGAQTQSLTLPGYAHDVCAAVHPLAAASPIFTQLPLHQFGLEWIEPPLALAHPFDDGPPAILAREFAETEATLDDDGPAYRALTDHLVRNWPSIGQDILSPPHWPRHPVSYARFGLRGLQPVARLVRGHFRGTRAQALVAGIGSHASQPLSRPGTAALALILAALAHRVGWPFARNGSRAIADALTKYLLHLGGRAETGRFIRSVSEVPRARVMLLDITPRQFLSIAGSAMPGGYRRALERFRYGPGVFKVDWALAGPVPWRSPEATRAGTLHLGGSFDEIAANENLVAHGAHPERPTVIAAQPSLFDESRAPSGHHTFWGYCHVPNGSDVDMLGRIEAQVERFAPGFRDTVIARHVMNTAQLEQHDPNLVGGDIGQGANTLRQLLFRPVVARNPYRTPIAGVYLCSASTPPGGGVHGMCGYHAAKTALADAFGIDADRVLNRGGRDLS